MRKQTMIAFILSMALLINGCQKKEESTTNTSQAQSTTVKNATTSKIDFTFADEDFDDSYDEQAISIDLSDTSLKADGVSIKNGSITISKAGTYVCSGTLKNGSIIVDAGKEDLVRIVLNNANITSDTSSAIYVKQAKKTVLILAKDSENTISDAKDYTYEDAEKEEPNAAIFSKDDLSITGSGKLIVNANFNHGIFSKNQLVITSGSFDITSQNDGLKGKDGIAIADGTFTINAQGDGMQASESQEESKGWVYIEAGTFHITSQGDGIQAETNLEICDGTFDITTGGGSQNASTKSDWGRWGPQDQTSTNEDTTSAKGIKSGKDMIISKGTYTFDTSDDAIHTNASMDIKDGTYTIQSGDDGIHADETLTVEKGSMDIKKSYEGIEGNQIVIQGGDIQVVSSDDGLNAAGGNDGSSMNGRPGQNTFSSSDSDVSITITGGNIYVNASGDGLDSNGNLYIKGGNVIVDGPQDSGNGALDYDGTCEITGGTLIAAGMSGMAQMPSDTSSQASMMITFDETQSENTLISLMQDNDLIIAYAPSKKFNNIVISTPSLTKDKTYSIQSGGTISGLESKKVITEGTINNASTLGSFTLSDMATSISQDGTSVQAGMNQPQGKPGGDKEMGGPGGHGM